MAAPEFCGISYRQQAKRLRINRGPGKPDKVSERPTNPLNEDEFRDAYLDSDEHPTLVEFDEFDHVNVEALLRSGAIVAYVTVKEAKKAADKAERVAEKAADKAERAVEKAADKRADESVFSLADKAEKAD